MFLNLRRAVKGLYSPKTSPNRSKQWSSKVERYERVLPLPGALSFSEDLPNFNIFGSKNRFREESCGAAFLIFWHSLKICVKKIT
jgi:hypothetical protein